MLNATMKRALQYVKNTNGGATVAQFMCDHMPIGESLWRTLVRQDLVTVSEGGKIFLTQEGDLALLEP